MEAWEVAAGMGGRCGHGRSRQAWEVTTSIGGHGGHRMSRRVTAGTASQWRGLHWDARRRKRCARV